MEYQRSSRVMASPMPSVCYLESRDPIPLLIPVKALLNIIEAILNIEYVYLRHTSPHTAHTTSKTQDRPSYHPHAPLIGFASALMTLSKTVLYFLQGELPICPRRETN